MMVDEAQNQQNEKTSTESNAPAEDSSDDVKAIMEFDPFGPPEPAAGGQDDTGEEPGEGEGGGEGEDEGGEPEPKPDPKAAAAAAEPPKQQGPSKREQELEAQVASLQRLIQQSQQSQPQQPQGKGEEAKPRYNLGLPPQIISGLRSDDDEEFTTAMHAVVNGIANKVWNDVQEHLSREVAPQFDQRIQAVVQHGTEVQRVHNDFYGTYPHLKNPMVMPIVQRAAMQVAQERQAVGKPIQWDKEFAEAVANYVHQVVPAPQQQPTPQAQPKPKTFVAQPGTRPAAPAGNEFASVL